MNPKHKLSPHSRLDTAATYAKAMEGRITLLENEHQRMTERHAIQSLEIETVIANMVETLRKLEGLDPIATTNEKTENETLTKGPKQ